ncbi:hypothetical protein [Streptomyces zingiberis]|uniref:50S ribosomal protein L32 n=1 Tax=Streptomyces zingiberis TaxID=2053010 RepID=A0ABX1BUE6_9ACTN|nr:hypothetical protein [Streptomyces zingiberis]NJQ00056.1 hypothetical protein [Streptomyces zingiberis]
MGKRTSRNRKARSAGHHRGAIAAPTATDTGSVTPGAPAAVREEGRA